MKSLFQEESRTEVLCRIGRLTPRSARLWGRMSAGQMVAHCADQLRLALGDLASGPASGPLRFPLLKKLAIYWVPWPKGRVKAPRELFTTRPDTWDGDLAALRTLIERFAGSNPEETWPPHPMFGPMSGRDWGALAYRHLDHHLRQFGQ
jgi:DinB family protein